MHRAFVLRLKWRHRGKQNVVDVQGAKAGRRGRRQTDYPENWGFGGRRGDGTARRRTSDSAFGVLGVSAATDQRFSGDCVAGGGTEIAVCSFLQ
ncbi:hypothetical protein [Oryza sativa Japonica Group]|uniref:Uncharacterized protein n=1 Tax=Oryza sativa subsp. japonica TaxID=39947 RepID=Q5N9T5_ORYSJ|nr:hypothetical protein [Oryza sativa Japonica Group]